jgi:hypothetical protein
MNQTTLTKEQLDTLVILQRIELTRKMFYVVTTAFFIVLAALIVCMFLPTAATNLKVSFGCIDVLLGWSFRAIVQNLYPPPTAPQEDTKSD